MKQETIQKLLKLNQDFYRYQAEGFNQTRMSPWRGWDRLMKVISKNLSVDAPSLLDLGCGNGRFLETIEKDIQNLKYLGVDSSQELLNIALGKFNRERVEFRQGDITLRNFLGIDEKFDVIVCLAVLHHVPGKGNRLKILKYLVDHLSVAGLLAVSVWNIENMPNLNKKLVTVPDLETGDYVLGFGDKQDYLRYVHQIQMREFDTKMRSLGMTEIDSWVADGQEGNLNQYKIWKLGT